MPAYKKIQLPTSITQVPTAKATQPLGFEAQVLAAPRDPWWKDWLTDPLIWLIDKFNRPQQALFSYMHETMVGGRGGAAAWSAFTKGGDVRFVDIMDDLGMQGQAGKFDPLDVAAAAGEILLDPANLIGVGAFAKFGKATKAIALADEEIKAMATLGKLGVKAGDLKKAGLVGMDPGQIGKRVMDDATNLLGPEPLSHFINVGAGRYAVSIPYSQYALEPLVRAGRKVRGWAFRSLSTQPRTREEAISIALKNVIERQKSGVNQLVGFMAKKLPQEWRKGKLYKKHMR